MGFELSPRQSRFLAVALALVVCALVVQLVALPLWNVYRESWLEIEQARDQIFRFRRVAASLDQLKRQMEELEQARTASRQILPESNPTFAAAALQERVKAVVTESGGKLTSTQVLPALDEGTFTRVALAVRMSVTTEALQRVLYDLEVGQPYLIVDKVMVIKRRARRARVVRRGAAPPPPAPSESLDVRFNVAGYARPASP